MATAGDENRDAHITIDSERTPAEVIDIRELVDNAKDFAPFPIIAFNCKKVPTDQACKEAVEFVESGNGNWAKTDITITDDKKREFQLSRLALSCVAMWQALRVC